MLMGRRVRTHKGLITNLRYQTQSALEDQPTGPLWQAYVAAARSGWKSQERLALPRLVLADSPRNEKPQLYKKHACMPALLVGEGPLGLAALPQAPLATWRPRDRARSPELQPEPPPTRGCLLDSVTPRGNAIRDAPASVLSSSINS